MVSACGHNTPAEQVHAYALRGYTGIIITDHFINGNSSCPRHLSWEEKMHFIVSSYEAAKVAGDACGLDVFLGWEYSIRGTDFLTYGLGLDFLLANPDFHRLNAADYSALVRSAGGYIVQAHPFRTGNWIAEPYPVDPSLLDGIEVFNASIAPTQPEANDKARAFAHKHGLAMQAGTDSHNVNNHFSSGIMMETKAETIRDIISAIKNGTVSLILPE